jgi:hypothetical protein
MRISFSEALGSFSAAFGGFAEPFGNDSGASGNVSAGCGSFSEPFGNVSDVCGNDAGALRRFPPAWGNRDAGGVRWKLGSATVPVAAAGEPHDPGRRRCRVGSMIGDRNPWRNRSTRGPVGA